MTQRLTTDVLICGAGAAGLSLAIDHARRGVDFRLIEKADEPFHGSRGKGIQPRCLEVFEDSGSSTGCSRPAAPIRRLANTILTAASPIRRSPRPPAQRRLSRTPRR